jgi:hypothetical protein
VVGRHVESEQEGSYLYLRPQLDFARRIVGRRCTSYEAHLRAPDLRLR